LKELVAKVRADDPNIAGIRVGQFSPTTVRLVLDLKQPIRPQVFALTPVAAYKHRLPAHAKAAICRHGEWPTRCYETDSWICRFHEGYRPI
jgi:hypothetical protein